MIRMNIIKNCNTLELDCVFFQQGNYNTPIMIVSASELKMFNKYLEKIRKEKQK